ncbi:MAG: hypothetical protein WCQ57_00970 [Verrucomicrobiota bacterium]
MRVAIEVLFFMMHRVRSVTIFFGLLAAVVLAGCSVVESDTVKVGDQFQRGIQGKGQIVPNNPTTDSFGSEYR